MQGEINMDLSFCQLEDGFSSGESGTDPDTIGEPKQTGDIQGKMNLIGNVAILMGCCKCFSQHSGQ